MKYKMCVIIKWLTTVLILLISLYMLQRLLMPKYMTTFTMGSLIGEYYEQDKNHDVLFVGDCEICTAFSPPYLWEKYGIHSYVRGSIQQTSWQTYYLLEEMLEEEKPKVVVFNVAELKYSKTVRNTYTRMTLDGMKWSKYKVRAVKESLIDEEHFIEYVFPILYYHDRWDNLTKEDFEWWVKKENVSFNGYYMLTGVSPYEEQEEKLIYKENLPKRSYEYLDKIRILCEKNDIELILIKGPGIVPEWHLWWNDEIEKYASEHGLTYINMLDMGGVIGIDYSTDTFSGGRHMNVYGAEKVSDYFGRILQEEFQIPDRRNDNKLEEYWKKELARYYEKKIGNVPGKGKR